MGKKKKGSALGKRIKISKTQRQMMLAVLGASLTLGVCLVLALYFIRYIGFNGDVIAAEDKALNNYEETILNVGLCVDNNGDGKLNNQELEQCDPTALDVMTNKKLKDTLRYNVLVKMSQNQDLESVAREALNICYVDNNPENEKIDYSKLYNEAETDTDRRSYISLMRMCSALRAIPDALPAQKNEEALMASLNQIFLLSGFQPESLSPGGNYVASTIPGLGTIPVSFVVETDSKTTLAVLSNMEKSIRSFDISAATIGWSDGGQLELRVTAVAYYEGELQLTEKEQTVYSSKDAKKKARQEAKK